MRIKAMRHLFAATLFTFCADGALAQEVEANGLSLSRAGSLEQLVTEARRARVVHIVGDSAEHGEVLQRARSTLIGELHTLAGYNVLAMPVGIFEGAWVDWALGDSAGAELGGWPVYRAWKESPAFAEFAAWLQATRSNGSSIRLIGTLSRYHAIGKELYTPHMLNFLDAADAPLSAELSAEVTAAWSGSARLARGTPELRARARSLGPKLLDHFDRNRSALLEVWSSERAELERQFLVNWTTFAELEQLRAGDLPEDPGFARREKQANLDWILNVGYPGEKVIVWEGRGDNVDAIPGAEAFVIHLAVTGT